jgi:dihydrofolate synthase/folylpolyglutamate synthase
VSDLTFNTLQEWLQWQQQLHPSEIELGLERVSKVLRSLHPQFYQTARPSYPFTIITIAGTNGKGSTVAMLEAILTQAGYHVGSYTSPHLIDYNERIKINQTPVSEQSICQAFERIQAARHDISLTYFEFGTLAAIDVFVSNQCEIIILEVGLGGRLDAVNAVDADVALVTTVDLDHQEWLGDNRDQIGLEKAGIYRQDKPAIFGDKDIPQSVLASVKQKQLQFFQFGRHYHYIKRDNQWDWIPGETLQNYQAHYNLPLPRLSGDIQLQNASNVLMILSLIRPEFPVTHADIKQGLLHTWLPGRFQLISDHPVIVVDVAHNVQAANQLKNNLQQFKFPGHWHVILGMLKDKDIKSVLSILNPLVASWRLIELDTPRAMPADQIASLIKESEAMSNSEKQKILCFSSFKEAYEDFTRYNIKQGQTQKLLVFGSFFTVSDALRLFSESVKSQ